MSGKQHPKAILPHALIKDALKKGVELYNNGYAEECTVVYIKAAKDLLRHTIITKSHVETLLLRAIKTSEQLGGDKGDYEQAAWCLRWAFDDFRKGQTLANKAKDAMEVIKVADRSYHLKKYANCFVGNHAVSVLVEKKLQPDRESATKALNDLLSVGLIFHVSSEHEFKDKYLFYRFASSAQIRKQLNNFSIDDTDLRYAMVKCSTILHRLMQVHTHPSLGVIRLDYDYPAAPGDIDHPGSYDYPVYYRVVPGLTFQMCQKGEMTPEVAKNFDDAVLWLANHEQVSAMTGDCGFMMWFIERVKAINTKKPVLLSSLMLLPSITASFGHADKVIIVTANGKSLDPMHPLLKRQSGIDAMDVRFIYLGCENVKFFGKEVEKGLKVDVEKAQPGIVSLILGAVRENPQTRAILMECTELPPYSDAVREATGLPVFDSITNCDFVMQAFLDNSRFGVNGWYEEWDGMQEKYTFGSELSVKERKQCIWCQLND